MLIPKIKCPLHPSNYRPISLCNVIYKIVAKVLNNRLVGALPSLVFENQTVFIKDRSILDNAMMVINIMHHIYSNLNLNMVVKLDMEKAFNRVD